MTQTTSEQGVAGTLEDGRNFVRFERLVRWSVERVWRALTDPGELASWSPGFEIELRVGGRFKATLELPDENAGGTPRLIGEVTHLEPPRRLTYCYGDGGSMSWELEAEGEDCRLRFMNVLGRDEPYNVSVLISWHALLDRLQDFVGIGSVKSFDATNAHAAEIAEQYRDQAG